MDKAAYQSMRDFRGPFVEIHEIAFYALAATAAVGAVIAALLIEPQPAQVEPEPEAGERQVAVVSQHPPVCRARRVWAGELQAN